MRVDEWVATARLVVSVAREKDVRVLAASLAYYLFNSLLPFLLLVFIGLSLGGNLDLLVAIVEFLTNVESRRLKRLFQVVTSSSPTRTRVILLAVGILGWSSVRLFIATDNAFAIVYGNREARSYTGMAVQIGFVFATVLLSVGALIGVAFAIASVVQDRETILISALLFVVLFVVFLTMFYVFPKGSVTLRNVLPGTAVSVLFWGVSGVGFRLYSTRSLSVDFYGAIGGLLILLSWLYLGAFVFIMGIILNGVLMDSAEGLEATRHR